jgi:SAM-dependent methyltransferase
MSLQAARQVLNEVCNVMSWIILIGLAGAGLIAVAFVLLTDGRYFGKRLMYRVYGRVGPAVFSLRGEAKQWHSLAECIGLHGRERVLDVGTAAGDLPLSIASMPDFRGQVVGLDWSPRMIRLAREEAGRRGLEDRARFEVVDIREGLPFTAGEFDVLICLVLLETLPEPDDVLEDFRRGWRAAVAARLRPTVGRAGEP